MKLEIDQEILNGADQCTQNRRCCLGRPEDLSVAAIKIIGEQRFICKIPDICSYKLSFGSSFFCTCPVRRAIFDKYGK